MQDGTGKAAAFRRDSVSTGQQRIAAHGGGWQAAALEEECKAAGAILPVWRVRGEIGCKGGWKPKKKLYYSVQLRQLKLPELALVNKATSSKRQTQPPLTCSLV
ncbi:hypothetical protein K3555_15150 [Leisingera sp. M527]|uniref:hypothetical protein n=1 Tax=Leisingera sp. M527 TaxID=2867014 RepID=UPI0021A54CE6|nr:hypothetical protein [Leisingera sp. M527]UWQ31914.1 hypothetical protein K3555_15150 [Leisingera sp. M527]